MPFWKALSLWRAFAALITGLGLAGCFLEEYATLMLPVIRHALAWWSPQFDVLDVQVIGQGRDTVIEAAMLTREHFLFYGRVIPAGGVINTSTLAGHMLVHVALLAVVLSAWPAGSAMAWLARLVAVGPALIVLAWADVPIIMTGSMHALILEQLAPESLSSARLVLAMQFLENGGRYVLILATGSAIILLCRLVSRQS